MKLPTIHADKLQAIVGQIGVAMFVLAFVNMIFVKGVAWSNVVLAFAMATAAIIFSIIKLR